MELRKTEDTVLANFFLPLDSILDCTRSKIEEKFTKELTIPEYVYGELDPANLNLSNAGKGKGDKKDKKGAKIPAKVEPPKGIFVFNILSFFFISFF